jgi:hypothetical protein
MGLGTKNRQKQTADICKQHLREKYRDQLRRPPSGKYYIATYNFQVPAVTAQPWHILKHPESPALQNDSPFRSGRFSKGSTVSRTTQAALATAVMISPSFARNTVRVGGCQTLEHMRANCSRSSEHISTRAPL